MSSLNKLLDEAFRKAAEDEPLLYTPEIRSKLEDVLQEALENVIPGKLTLDSDKPDFESIFLRLVQELQANPVWTDLIPSATGMTILRNISAGIALILFANERALQEVYPGSATSSNSIYMATRALGVNPKRRVPSRVNVSFTRLDFSAIATIPRFTQFNIRGSKFFNREQVTFNENILNAGVVLYQGELITLEATSEGNPLDRIEIGTESGFISQEDVYLFVDGKEWETSLVGLYNYARDAKIVHVSTLPNQNVEIQFGDDRYGAMPSVNANIKIIWAETEGEVQNYNVSGLEVEPQGSVGGLALTGVTTTAIYGGAEALGSDFYKLHAPSIHSKNKGGGATIREQWKTTALEYPNVVDVMFRFAAELNPGLRSMMNYTQVTVLLKNGQVWSALEWDKFVEYMHANTTYKMEYGRKDPLVAVLNIGAKVHCRPNADLNKLKVQLEADIREQYKPRLNSLGFNIFHSDISDILEGKDGYADQVEYVTDITPAVFPVLESELYYNQIGTINLQMFYTTRNEYGGRKEPW